MNQSSQRSIDDALAFLGLLLALPAIYFFTGSFLKYEMNLLANVEISIPPPRVMIGGLLVAIILNLFSLFRIKSTSAAGTTIARTLRSRALNAIIAGIALLFLSLLLGYVLLENLAESNVASMYVDSYRHT